MYFKITNINENNENFQYVDGLNVSLIGQDFWITDIKHVLGYLGHGYYLRDVEIPVNDPNLIIYQYVSKTKWITNKIFLGKKYLLSDIKTIQYLLDLGADIHTNNDYALSWAAHNGYADIVKLLLDYGANVHAFNDQALCWASESGHFKVIQILIDYGANIHIFQDEPLRLASMNGYYRIVELFLASGADIHAFDDDAVKLARANGHDTIVDLLMNYNVK
jgi:ankyrin repeat protein